MIAKHAKDLRNQVSQTSLIVHTGYWAEGGRVAIPPVFATGDAERYREIFERFKEMKIDWREPQAA